MPVESPLAGLDAEWAGYALVAGMAVITYLTRISGFILLARLPDGGFLRRWLDRLPGATFAALAIPLLAAGGPPEWIAATALFCALRFAGSVPLALVAYIAVVAGGRAILERGGLG